MMNNMKSIFDKKNTFDFMQQSMKKTSMIFYVFKNHQRFEYYYKLEGKDLPIILIIL